MHVGSRCHASLAQRNEIVMLNPSIVDVVLASVVIGKITR